MGGIGESWTGVGDEFDANATAADALVVTSDQAKVWKERLDSCGLLDRSRRVVSIPNDESLERPAAVVFPVKLSSAGSLPLELGDGCKLCKLPLPAAARPVNQRAGRQRSASSAENGEEYAVYGAPLPPPPQLLSDAQTLWPAPVPDPPHNGADVRRIPCPATAEEFAELVTCRGEPVILTGMPMGKASALWTPDYLTSCPEASKIMDVHVCPPKEVSDTGAGTRGGDSDDLIGGGEAEIETDTTVVVDLAGHRKPGTRRNFTFRKMTFGELIQRVSSNCAGSAEEANNKSLSPVVSFGEKYYLRSVAHKAPADLSCMFPSLAADLRPGMVLPGGTGECSHTLWPRDAYHSSVLRIASPGTALWTHYDTHDNLLAQVRGGKTVTLWAPDAEPFLYVEGSSSRVDDIVVPDFKRFPLFSKVSDKRWVASLGPGEALYIPALWFHHVLSHPRCPEFGDMSIAVNVFWRCLPEQDHDAGDLYGNKDPPAARQASELAARAGAAISQLPEPHKSFYARRTIKRLAEQLGMRLEW